MLPKASSLKRYELSWALKIKKLLSYFYAVKMCSRYDLRAIYLCSKNICLGLNVCLPLTNQGISSDWFGESILPVNYSVSRCLKSQAEAAEWTTCLSTVA